MTLVYTDPPGDVGAGPTWKNDLDLWVNGIGTTGTYYGNYGLVPVVSPPPDYVYSNWSIPGGSNDFIGFDTVENVFIQNPGSGCAEITVYADAITMDGHVETPTVEDVDFALIVSVEFDCNGDQIADAEQIADGLLADANDNGIPDECELTWAVLTPVGCRYLAVTPNSADGNIALRTTRRKTSPGTVCNAKYVTSGGTLGDPPVYQTPAQWGTKYVGSDYIVPSGEYGMQRQYAWCGNSLSNTGTAVAWKWGDATGEGDVDVDDIICVLDGFSGVFTNCTLYGTDLVPCVPDGLIDVDDLIAVNDAFSGVPFCVWCDDPCDDSSCGGRAAQRGISEPQSPGNITLVPRTDSDSPGVLEVDIFLSDAADLRGYEIALDATLPDGTIVPWTNLSIDVDRPDYLFHGMTTRRAVDLTRGRLVAVLSDLTGVPSAVGSKDSHGSYVGTAQLELPVGVDGEIRASLRMGDTRLRDSARLPVAFNDAGSVALDLP